MANELIKLKTGSLSKMNDANGGLSQVAIDKGTVYFATDSTTKAGKIWFDTTDGKRIDMTAFSQESINAITADNVSGTVAIVNGGTGATTTTAAKENLGLGNAKIFHGTCDTAAATVAKVVTCSEFKTTDLIKGAIIFVTFDNTNSGNVKNITLNVNGTGAKPIKQMYNGAIANFSNTNNIFADQTYSFTYDGTNWVCGNVDTNNSWSVMSADELKAGTATSNRIMRASYIKSAFTASDGIFQPGSADGTISIYGQDLAVTGLGSAAFTESSTYATKTEVNGLLAASDAMVFKGTIAGTSTSPGAYTPAANCGDTYKVSTAGYINGQKVEIGDMFICTADSTVAATSSNYSTVQATWSIVQTNADGIVIGPSSATNGNIPLFDGTTGKLIKNSSYKPSSFATSGHTHDISLASGGTSTVDLAANTAYTLTAGGKSVVFKTPADTTYGANRGISLSSGNFGHSNSAITAQGTQALYPIKIDAYGHITGYGTAVTSLPASDVYAWAKAATKPTYTASEVGAATADHNHDSVYVKKSGDTMTGRLTMSGKAINQILTGTGTAASYSSGTYFPAKWTFNTSLTVTDGDIFTIKIPVAGHDYGVFMSIDNGTNYYPVVVSGTGRVTTHYPANTYIQVIFESTGSAASMFPLAGGASRITVSNGVFRVINFYDSGNSGLYQNYNPKAYKIGTTAITAYDLLAEDATGLIVPAHKVAHRVGSPIYIASSAKAANATGTWWDMYQRHYNMLLRKDGNNLSTTAYNPIYLKGTISNGLFTPDTTTPYVFTKADCNVSGAYYMFVGDAQTSASYINFNDYHPYYYYNGSQLLLCSEIAGSVAWANISGKPSSMTPSSHAHGNITNDGKIGTAANKAAYTTTNGVVIAGTLPAAAGGTGKTNLKDSANALINALDTGSSTPVDADYYISQYVSGGTSTTTYHRRPMSALWSYIKGKADSVYATSGHTHDNYMVKGVDYVTAGKASGITMGTGATAEGNGTKPTGNYSHAEGFDSEASGDYSHAEGYNTKATKSYSHAEGYMSKAQAQYSHAEGYSTTITSDGEYGHAEGASTTVSGNYGHAEGYGTKATAIHSHAEGGYTEATSNAAHSEGYGAKATGDYSHAEGYYTQALSSGAHAEGYNSKAASSSSHAEGYNSVASGDYSHAEGRNTTAAGWESHAEGNSTAAAGLTSHAEGDGTVASGYASHAEGIHTIANHESQHVFGEYNIPDSSGTTASSRGNYVEIVGNGTTSSACSNARTLDWAGNEVLAGSLTVGAAKAIASNESVMLQYNSTTKSLDFIFN